MANSRSALLLLLFTVARVAGWHAIAPAPHDALRCASPPMVLVLKLFFHRLFFVT